ncbi:MAG: caspase family protein [Bacteroidota bacterium]|nr:caspase family protein [Bacteroidota bacterium]
MNIALPAFSLNIVRSLLLAAGVLLFSGIQAQTTGTVYFVGIGIENCKMTSAPQKAMAKSDVNAVLAKTKNDLEKNRISYYSTELNKQIRYSDIIPTCLFDEFATLESIDLLFEEIAAKANPYDIFYFYINAPCDGKTGSFYLPSRPLKKGEKPLAQVMLDPSKLQILFSRIPCRNQLVIVDDASWKTFHGTFTTQFFQSRDKQKNQVLLVPSSALADTFSIAENKKACLLAALVCNTETPMLYVFDDNGVNDIDDALGFTAYDLTKKKQKFATFYTSASSAQAGSLVNKPAEKGNDAVKADTPPPGQNTQLATPAVLTKPTAKQPAARGPVPLDNEKLVADSIIGTIRNYALIVGVSDYKDSAWHDLPNPVGDASALNEELKNHYGFETNFLENPTKSELHKALTSLMSKNFDKNSQVLIFFAGHGGKNAVDGFFVPSDGKDPAQDEEMNTVITYSMLWRIIKGLPSQHTLLILDACYSGTFDEDAMAANRELAPDKKINLDKLRLVRERMQYGFKGYIASGIEPVSDGTPGKHSPFMNSLLDCLRNGFTENYVVTFSTLSAAVEKTTTPVPRCSIINKEPGGDFLFIPQARK